jgi:hypothetical protein
MSRRAIICTTVFLSAFALYVSRGVADGGLDALPELGDGHDYDALAYSLWHHGTFAFDWDDPGWRRPYEGHPEFADLLTRRSAYPTSYRQPGMPILLAATYAVSDRSFAAWRLVSCALTAGAVTLAAATAAALGGPIAAVVTGLLALNLPLVTLFSYQFRPESLASLFVALLAYQWVRARQDGWSTRRAVTSGLTLGALMATRSVFALWLPLALVVPGLRGQIWGAASWRLRALCLSAALAVIAPWWVRNVIILDAFMPMGTQGAYNLPAGFGPRAVRFQGMWASNPEDGLEEVAALKLDFVSAEVKLAQYRQRLATRWMRSHPWETIQLMYLHVWQEIRPRTLPYPTGAWLLPLTAVSALALALLRTPGTAILVLMVTLNALGIALTWSVAGRFMAPVQPIMAAIVGALAGTLVRRTRRRPAIEKSASS